ARRSSCGTATRSAARAGHPGKARLVRRYGADAALVLTTSVAATGWEESELLAPIVPGNPAIPTVWAELVFGVTHEGAATVGDLLDRRTRIGLVPADRELAVPAAEKVLALLLPNR
ncbi:MAG TPA: glycerol-3-phosphate dehydrogenase C-terminal domain-containing protein, partial [Nocardioides sp.]|nr:glycerol-3-phosphate dehydrogenase C-terminal domain-containing protein [Nocardioides sp.]